MLNFNKKTITNTSITLGILGLVALLFALSGTKTQKTVEKNLTKPKVDLIQRVESRPSNTYKTENLTPDPEQVILFNTEVSDGSVNMTIERIRTLEKQKKDIYLVLDSPGGSVFDGVKLIAFIEASTVKVNTVCLSLCASMAAQIFSHGDTRYMISGATLMFHQAAGGVQGPLKEMTHRLNYVTSSVTKMDAYVADRAGIDRNEFDKMVEHELWIDSDDSIDKGLADKLVVLDVKVDQPGVFSLKREMIKLNIPLAETLKGTNPLKEFN